MHAKLIVSIKNNLFCVMSSNLYSLHNRIYNFIVSYNIIEQYLQFFGKQCKYCYFIFCKGVYHVLTIYCRAAQAKTQYSLINSRYFKIIVIFELQIFSCLVCLKELSIGNSYCPPKHILQAKYQTSEHIWKISDNMLSKTI